MSETPSDRRRRGQPKVFDEPGSRVTIWIPRRIHDAAAKAALQRGQSVNAVFRTIIHRNSATALK